MDCYYSLVLRIFSEKKKSDATFVPTGSNVELILSGRYNIQEHLKSNKENSELLFLKKLFLSLKNKIPKYGQEQ